MKCLDLLRELDDIADIRRFTYRRQISWSAAMHNMRADWRAERDKRPSVNGMMMATWSRLAAERAAKSPVPLVNADGSFNRSAIMAAAWSNARLHRTLGDKESWSEMLSYSLTGAWRAAKAARARLAH